MKLLEAALAYAAQGQPVFPLHAGAKRPATRHGLNDATLDVDQITAWWSENPAYNIGLRTGVRFDVIDVDGAIGTYALDDWADRNGGMLQLPSPTVWTPRGGVHIYVAVSGAGNRTGMLDKVDYRGVGGYVVGPPSILTIAGTPDLEPEFDGCGYQFIVRP